MDKEGQVSRVIPYRVEVQPDQVHYPEQPHPNMFAYVAGPDNTPDPYALHITV